MLFQKRTQTDALENIIKGRSLTKLAVQRFMRNRFAVVCLVVFIILMLMATFADYITVWAIDEADYDFYRGQPPNWEAAHYLGTDKYGRDLFTRSLFGMRISILVALVAAFVALTVGVAYGTISGFIGGRTDNVMMRIVDVLQSYPTTLLAIIALAYFGRNIYIVFMVIGLVEWQIMARVIRGQVVSLRNSEFVEAARSYGATRMQIVFRHMVPNVIGIAVVYLTLIIPEVILVESFLGFLGLGVQEPQPSLGSIIGDGATSVERKPWLVLAPGIFLVSMLFCLNYIGDGLRDAFDPKDR